MEVQGTLYDGAAGVTGTAIGKEPAGNRNSARTWWRRERDSGRRVRPKCSGLGVAGLKRDELVAGEKQRGCSWEEAVREGEAVWASGMEAGEKRQLGCPRSSGCTCNIKNRVISDTWR